MPHVDLTMNAPETPVTAIKEQARLFTRIALEIMDADQLSELIRQWNATCASHGWAPVENPEDDGPLDAETEKLIDRVLRRATRAAKKLP